MPKNKKSKPPLKRFIVRKFIMATSVQQALRKERNHLPEDCFIDLEWDKEHGLTLESAIGYRLSGSP